MRYALHRLLGAALTLVLVTMLVFALIHLAPGDPLAATDEEGLHPLSDQARTELRALYRLDQPLHRQYILWLQDLAQGRLGTSFHDRRPVSERIRERAGTTLALNTIALGLTLLVAVPLGAAAALRPGSPWDRLAGLPAYALYAVPVFWAGIMLQSLFAVRLDWLPLAHLRSEGWRALGPVERLLDLALHLVLPVICLSYGGWAYVSRFVRGSLIESAAVESWRAARGRGLGAGAVLYRHGLRQASLPLLTLAGFLLPGLLGGSVIVETLFAIPGLGELLVAATFQRDVPVLMGLTLLSGVATLGGILLADLAYGLADPRVRRG